MLSKNKGITLIEVIVVIALVAIVSSFGLFISMDNYNDSSFRNERDLFISALMHARAQAMDNTCLDTSTVNCTDGKEHGVYIDKTGNDVVTDYVIFQGATYNAEDPTNEIIKANHYITSSGASEVDFA